MSEKHLAEDRLHDYVEGRLAALEAEAIRNHLEACPQCADEVEALRSLLGELAELPAGIPPAGDLWPEVAARTRPQDRRSIWEARYPLAAAAVLLILATTAVNSVLMGTKEDPGGASSATLAERAPVPSAAMLVENEWLRDYSAAIDDLTLALEERRASLSPETVRILEENLRVIDEAIAESLEALGREPSNEAARKTVVYAHARKLDLLRRAVETQERI